MPIYELTLILQADLDEESRNQIIERVMGWVPIAEGVEAPEPKIDHWGRKQLAYPINKTTEGYYVYIETPMDADGISEMERQMTYVDEILRHLVVRQEGQD